MSNPPPPSTTESRLLALAPELRNRIYRHALHEQEQISITSQTFSQPGLLQTCKQIRHEAKAIYSLENEFRVATNDFECKLLKAFCHQARGSWSNYGTYVPSKSRNGKGQHTFFWHPTCLDSSSASWGNLLEWFKSYYNDEVVRFGGCPCWCDGKCAAVVALFDVVTEMSSRPWAEILPILNIVKIATEQQAESRWCWDV